MRLGFFSIGVLLMFALVPLAQAEPKNGIYLTVERGDLCLGLGCERADAAGVDIRFGLILVCGQVGSSNDVDYGSGCNEGGGLTSLEMLA